MDITIGAGFYGDAIAVALVILLTLKYSHYLKLIVPKKQTNNRATIILKVLNNNIERVINDLENHQCDIDSINIKRAIAKLYYIINLSKPC